MTKKISKLMPESREIAPGQRIEERAVPFVEPDLAEHIGDKEMVIPITSSATRTRCCELNSRRSKAQLSANAPFLS